MMMTRSSEDNGGHGSKSPQEEVDKSLKRKQNPFCEGLIRLLVKITARE